MVALAFGNQEFAARETESHIMKQLCMALGQFFQRSVVKEEQADTGDVAMGGAAAIAMPDHRRNECFFFMAPRYERTPHFCRVCCGAMHFTVRQVYQGPTAGHLRKCAAHRDDCG